MNSAVFTIDAHTFSAQIELNLTTHKVVKSSPCLGWMVGMTSFEVFRVCHRRDWYVNKVSQNAVVIKKPNEYTQQLLESFSDTYQQSHSQSE